MTKIFLKKGRDESLRRFHPWVFSGAVAQVQGNPSEGDLVAVHSAGGEYLACGHWQIGSIAVRILSFDADPSAPGFWTGSLRAAFDARTAAGLTSCAKTNCYRLVHGEGDGLPGLIIDWYESEVTENGHRFLVNWSEGQKTGFFLDQRENRALVERYAAGRNVLNLFCYTGGFSVYALGGGAVHVDSVDSSARAMALVDRNIALNGFDPASHGSHCADAMDFLAAAEDGKYDLMRVDPPAFAKHRGALRNALRAYQRLNAKAISKVAPGGLVFTFSCSQVVDREMFALAVFSAAAETGRRVRILDRLNQPADHAVNIYHPEGEYLKGLLLYVE